MADRKRPMPVVTPEQAEALHLLAHHYDVLGVLLRTMTVNEMLIALVRGFQTAE